MKLAVVIPSKNGLHHLKECLPTVVRAAQNSAHEVMVTVVDDNSTDNTLTALPPLFPSVQVVANPQRGVCSARNWGVTHTPGDWIVFLDNDVFLEEQFFDTLSQYFLEDVFCVSCCGYCAYPTVEGTEEQLDGVKLFQWRNGYPRFTGNVYNQNLPPSGPYFSWGVQGAYFACNRKKFDQLGGYDLLFEPYLLEETDLAYRGLKRGWRISYAPNTAPHHKCGGTINSKKSSYTKYLSKRNRILFVWKNIHSKKLLFRHFCWLLLRPHFKAIYQCLKLLPQIKQKRKEEFACRVYSDEELLFFSQQGKYTH